MGEIVNFNRFRTKRTREEAARKTEVNRIYHGRTKNQKQRDKSETTRKDCKYDNKHLD